MKEGLQLINALPDTLKDLMMKFHGINYSFDVCHTDVECGYGSRICAILMRTLSWPAAAATICPLRTARY